MWYALDADMEPNTYGSIISASSLLVHEDEANREADGILIREAV
jgi:hypothetical protein